MTNTLYLFALSSSLKTTFCVICWWRFFPFFQTVHHLASQFCPPSALLGYVGFAQFRKFDLKFETEIIIRSKYWNFSFCGKFVFFSCSFRLSLVTDIKPDYAKFTEDTHTRLLNMSRIRFYI